MINIIRHVCFDLDNTLVDDSGDHLRPAMRELLDSFAASGVTLSLWTASTKERAVEVLRWHRLTDYFTHCVYREDYDPECSGYPKDITYLNADLLVDDTSWHVEFVRSKGKQGFVITPFLDPALPVPPAELRQLHELVLPGKRWAGSCAPAR